MSTSNDNLGPFTIMGRTYSVLTTTEEPTSVTIDINNINPIAQSLEGVALRITLPNNALLRGYDDKGAEFTIPIQDVVERDTLSARGDEALQFNLETDGVDEDDTMMFDLLVEGTVEDRVEIPFTPPA